MNENDNDEYEQDEQDGMDGVDEPDESKAPDKLGDLRDIGYGLPVQSIGIYGAHTPIRYEVWLDGVYKRKLELARDPKIPWPLPQLTLPAPDDHRNAHLERIGPAIYISRVAPRLEWGRGTVGCAAEVRCVDVTGRWQQQVVDLGTVTDRTRILRLSRYGYVVSSENSRDVVTYLAAAVEAAADQAIAAVRRVGLYELPDGRIGWLLGRTWVGPDPEKIIVDTSNSTELMRSYGSEDPDVDAAAARWRTFITPFLEFPIARWMLGVGTEAVIASLIDARQFGIHIVSRTRKGKTALLRLGLSPWARELATFNGTEIGLHSLFETQLSHVMVAIDELQMASEKLGTTALIYKILGGQGRTRLNPDGTDTGNADVRYHAAPITTGEQGLLDRDKIGQGGDRTRICEVSLDELALPDDLNRQVHQMLPKLRCRGAAGQVLLTRVCQFVNETPHGRDVLKKMYSETRAFLANSGVDDEAVLDQLGPIVVGEWLALRFLLDWGNDRAYETALADALAVWHACIAPDRAEGQGDIAERAVISLQNHYAANRAAYVFLGQSRPQFAQRVPTMAYIDATRDEIIYIPAEVDRLFRQLGGAPFTGEPLRACTKRGFFLTEGKHLKPKRQRGTDLPPARYPVGVYSKLMGITADDAPSRSASTEADFAAESRSTPLPESE